VIQLLLLLSTAIGQEVIMQPEVEGPLLEEVFEAVEPVKTKSSAFLLLLFLGKLLVFSVITGLILVQLFLKT